MIPCPEEAQDIVLFLRLFGANLYSLPLRMNRCSALLTVSCLPFHLNAVIAVAGRNNGQGKNPHRRRRAIDPVGAHGSPALPGLFFVLEAPGVAAGIQAFESEQPTAVLLDVNLPDGSGLDALREFKRRQPDAVIIMMTGNVMVSDTIAALRGGLTTLSASPSTSKSFRSRSATA